VRKVVHRKDERDRDRYVLGIEKSALGSEYERYSRKSRDGLSDNYSKTEGAIFSYSAYITN
jgi:hypothetical protein